MNGESQKILSGNLEAWLYQTLGGHQLRPRAPRLQAHHPAPPSGRRPDLRPGLAHDALRPDRQRLEDRRGRIPLGRCGASEHDRDGLRSGQGGDARDRRGRARRTGKGCEIVANGGWRGGVFGRIRDLLVSIFLISCKSADRRQATGRIARATEGPGARAAGPGEGLASHSGRPDNSRDSLHESLAGPGPVPSKARSAMKFFLRPLLTALACVAVAVGVTRWLVGPNPAGSPTPRAAVPVPRVQSSPPYPRPGLMTFPDPNAPPGSSAQRVPRPGRVRRASSWPRRRRFTDKVRDQGSLREYREAIAHARRAGQGAVGSGPRPAPPRSEPVARARRRAALWLYRQLAFVAMFEGAHDEAGSWLEKALALSRARRGCRPRSRPT